MKITITAPDGKKIKITLPNGLDKESIENAVDEVVTEYMSKKEPSKVWGGIAGYDVNTPMPTGEMQPEAKGKAKVKPTMFEGVAENVDNLFGKSLRSAEATVRALPALMDGADIGQRLGNYASRYQELANRSKSELNPIEQIVTDPVTYLPVPKFSKIAEISKPATTLVQAGKNALKYAIEPTAGAGIQAGAEYALNPDMTAEEAALTGAIGGTGGVALKGIGSALPKGAIASLAQRMKLGDKLEPKDYSVLFEEKQIPLFGGNEAIASKVENTIKDIGKGREKVVNKAIQEGEEAQNKLYINAGKNTSALKDIYNIKSLDDMAKSDPDAVINFLDDLRAASTFEKGSMRGFIDTPKLRNDIYADIDNQIAIGKMREDDAAKIKQIVDNELTDLENATQATAKYWDEGENTLKAPRLDYFMNRKSTDWYDKGKVGTKAYDELTTTQSKAYNLLSKYGAGAINEDPIVASYNKKFAKYIPLEEAMSDKAPTWGRSFYDVDVTKPMTIVRPLTSSNAGLIARYNLGGALQQVRPQVTTFGMPFINGKKETE